jgi:hypothetical protein
MRPHLLALLLFACAGQEPPPSTPPADTDGRASDTDPRAPRGLDDLMTVTAELRDALRTSPDHRTARAEALIAGGDPDAILAFVRDEIGLVPPTSIDGFVPKHRQRLFGARGALRGGVGTMRDRAELLAWMMTEAGFPSRVGAGLAPAGFTLTPGLGASAPFAPVLPPEALARWAALWGVPVDADLDIPTFDPQAGAAALAAALRPLVDTSRAARLYDLQPDRVALVEISTPDGIVWGNPNHPEATLADPKVRGGLDPEEPAEETRLRVRAWGRRAGTGDEVELVEGFFPLPSLVGRRVSFRMPRAADPSDLLPLRPTEVPLVVPTLTVDDPHAAAADVVSVSGPPVTLYGDTLGEDGALVRAGGGALRLEEDVPARLARVRTLEVEADARRFDEVRLSLRPRDADGAVVPGLPVGSFELREDGAPVDGLLTANARAPRVLVLLDRSSSVPSAFRGEEGAGFVGAVADATLAAPGAQIGVMAVGDDTVTWRDDRGDVLADLTALPVSSSALWRGLDHALALSPGVVLFVTDAAADDAPDDAELLRLGQTDARLVVLAVGEVEQETAEAMAAASGGRVVAAADPEAALAVVDEVLAEDDATYQLVYRAPPTGPRVRQVEARVGALTATDRYEVPPEPTPRRALVGLYLTVEVEGRGVVTRTLAGLAPDAPATSATAATLSEVEAATHGVASVVVEGGTPGLSEVLADHLEARLTLASLARAEDDPARLAALDAGFLRLPLDPLWLLMGAVDDPERPPTLPLGPQLVLWSDMPAFAPSEGQRAVDLLVLDRWTSPDADAEAAFRATFDHTLQLALVEQVRHATSTASLLEGLPLRRLAAPDVADAFPDVPGWRTLADGLDDSWDLLVPEDGRVVAAWAVHAPTGSVIGLLSDQRGGGNTRVAGLSDELRIYELIDKLHGAWGLGGGVWIKLEIVKAKLVGYATAAILGLDGTGGDVPAAVEPSEVAENLICSLVEDAIVDALPERLAQAIKNVSLLAVLLDLPPPSGC